MLIDAHAHLDQYDDTVCTQALAQLEAQDILTISVAMDPASYRRACALAERSPWVVPTFGIHPWRAPDFVHDLDALQPLIDQSPMLGEIGLDYYWVEDSSAYPAQRAVFEYFLAAARDQRKIVNVHTKGAEAEVLELLERYHIERGIVHWYSGPLALVDGLIDRGAYFTIGVEVHSSPLIQQLALQLPLDRLLVETDNPGGLEWLTGEVGMPIHLTSVIDALAHRRAMNTAEMRHLLLQNFACLVGNDPRMGDVQTLLNRDREEEQLP